MDSYKTYSDEQLLTLLKESDDYFDEVFHRYNTRLFPHVLKFVKFNEVAEEIVQEVFVKLWLNRSVLKTLDNPTAWLFTLATNLSLDFLKQYANQQRILENFQRSSATTTSVEEVLSYHENEQIINNAISSLSPKKQIVFRLSREQGMTHNQIAEKLNISSSTVNNHLVSALESIHSYIKKAGILVLSVLFF